MLKYSAWVLPSFPSYMFRNGEVTAQSGTGLEFNLMLAVILGGMPMRGGEKCRFMAAVVGAMTVAVLENGLVLWGLDPALVNGVNGPLYNELRVPCMVLTIGLMLFYEALPRALFSGGVRLSNAVALSMAPKKYFAKLDNRIDMQVAADRSEVKARI